MTMPSPPAVAESYGLWLLLDLTVTIDPFYKVITAITDRPFIATLFWNCAAPVPEPRLRIRRGVQDWRDPHISWHPWGWVRQEEPGDVLVHTFILTAGYIPPCIWFRIEGGKWFELLCPECGSNQLHQEQHFSFHCWVCDYTWDYFSWTCPNCGVTKGVTWGIVVFTYCDDCGYHARPDDFKRHWHNLSYSPFFFEQWDWPPVLGCIFYEPWTYIHPDPPDMYLLFKERWTS